MRCPTLNGSFPQTHEEFRQVMNGYKHNKARKFRGSLFMEPNFLVPPKQVDWREQGYVTPVKDQVSLFASRHWAFVYQTIG